MHDRPAAHLEDVELIREGPYDEKPGESEIEQGDIDQIPEVEITQEDLYETGERTDNWLIFGGSYEGQRYFPGDGITPDNVDELELEYQLENPAEGDDHQGTPLVVHGDPPIMYYTVGPDSLYALNARTGEILWSHVYEPATGAAESGASAERGPAVLGDTVYKSTLDYGVLAIDRYTGEERWYYNGACVYRDEPADELVHWELDYETFGPTSSFPPLIYEGTLMKGTYGAEWGVTGFFDAINLDGEPQWRVNTTPEDLWVGESWVHAGGTTWASGAIDPETETVIAPCANPGPWYGTVRPGWNPYTAGKVALDIETGEYQWNYQDAPHEWWDYDSPSPALVYDADVDGDERRLASWPSKTGWVYTVDVETGELVERSEGYVQHMNTWSLPPQDDIENAPWIIPELGGGTNPQPSSYHRDSRTMVVTAANTPMQFSWFEIEYDGPEFPFEGMETERATEDDDIEEWNGHQGVIAGLDPVTGDLKWQEWRDESQRGVSVSTAPGVTFLGTAEGEFIAYETETGEHLWEDDIGGNVRGGPICWEDPDEETHYVAVSVDEEEVLNVYSLEA
ncbi:PQQ-binding-like beta-propeller repeat protein [Natrialba sp. SSL1]|uniref:outer membrane protein assembly factor BamB family protein n=1 Tax=Natrialba sp. SSL1 TaxID=1869245 RepID=UPI0008F91C1F|nr:PQQ-binding-like beta-propeller repeat protein [Natrialba sp. SSL1]OIB58585.1 dehydrogenase [Natrialba sp. SSL1]